MGEKTIIELKSEVFDILVQIESLTAEKNRKLQEIVRLQDELLNKKVNEV